ncbi:hypothetical protein [Microbacterium tumbae]
MTTPTPTPDRGALLWRVIIIAILAIGVIVAVLLPMLSGNVRSFVPGLQIVAFGILIAAIRSLRR